MPASPTHLHVRQSSDRIARATPFGMDGWPPATVPEAIVHTYVALNHTYPRRGKKSLSTLRTKITSTANRYSCPTSANPLLPSLPKQRPVFRRARASSRLDSRSSSSPPSSARARAATRSSLCHLSASLNMSRLSYASALSCGCMPMRSSRQSSSPCSSPLP